MAIDLVALLWRTTVSASLAAAFVMAVRLPLRRACGGGVGYAAWLAVPLTVLATMLPPPAFQAPALGMTTITRLVVDAAPSAIVEPAAWTWRHGAALLWSLGAIAMAARQVRAQRAWVRGLGPLTCEGDVAVSRSASFGPCLIGLRHPVIALPSDFDERYTPLERELIVAHERAHADARDPLVNLLCAACVCIWWFDPLIHIAARLLRQDQELARDADVMRAFPARRRAYADAMLKTTSSSPVDPIVVCRWEPKHPLKERLMNLSRTPSNTARRIGRSVLTLGLLGAAYAAWAEQGTGTAPDDRGARPTPVVTAPVRSLADWEHAKPSSTVTVSPGPHEGQFLVSARVVDLETSRVLSTPRVLTRAGFPATMEVGDGRLLVRFKVTVYPSGKQAAYTNEVLRDGQLESSQSAILVVDASGPSLPSTTPIADAGKAGAADGGPYELKVVFSSTSEKELSCVADVFAENGKADLAEAMRDSWDGKRHTAAFSTVSATLPPEADRLVASLAKCQLGIDSKLTWSVARRAA